MLPENARFEVQSTAPFDGISILKYIECIVMLKMIFNHQECRNKSNHVAKSHFVK